MLLWKSKNLLLLHQNHEKQKLQLHHLHAPPPLGSPESPESGQIEATIEDLDSLSSEPKKHQEMDVPPMPAPIEFMASPSRSKPPVRPHLHGSTESTTDGSKETSEDDEPQSQGIKSKDNDSGVSRVNLFVASVVSLAFSFAFIIV